MIKLLFKNKVKSNIEIIKLIAFGIYNLSYVMNMAGYIPKAYNYMSLIVFVIICFITYLYKYNNRICIKNKRDLQRFLLFYIFIIIYSFIVQCINNDIQSYLLTSSLYIILPMLVAYIWFISTDTNYMMIYFNIFFIRLVLHFILVYGVHISRETISTITWSDSKSSVFESNLAHDFMFMTFIFLYKNKRKLAYISVVFCLLSFKRISFMLSIGLLFFFRYIPNRKCNKVLIYILIFVTCISPFLYGWLISNQGQEFFLYKFNINLDQLFTGRIYSINKWLAEINEINGYGSISHFINIGNENVGRYSMHCDLYQLYLECSIIGVVLFSNFIFKFSSKSYHALFLGCYIVLELFVSQFFINLSIWMIFYMFVFMIGSEKKPYKKTKVEE